LLKRLTVVCLASSLAVIGAASLRPASATVSAREITNSLVMKLALIPAGHFLMGSTRANIARVQRESMTNGYDNEGPRHEVTIKKAFYLGVYPVTQGQYRKVMGTNPSWFAASGGGKDDVAGRYTDDYPVEMVSWKNAKDFCAALGKKEGKTYRLPTEAEWEFACRAGTTTDFNTGDGAASLDRAGWHRGNSDGTTRRVGQLAPNAWGLYDMHGNVCQWCEDWFDADTYMESARVDPVGPHIGECKVLRGGSFIVVSWGCRSRARAYGRHDNRDTDCGFRVVMVAD
jgi:formylglycine-generating enzyme required for sulfatase activity